MADPPPSKRVLCPSATVPETDGEFTNTKRLVQWHERPDRRADCRVPMFTPPLKRLKQTTRLDQQNDAPFLALTGTSRRKVQREPRPLSV